MVFGGGPLNTIKLFLAKCFIIILSSYMKNVFLSSQGFLKPKFVGLVDKGYVVKKRHLKICITTKFFIDENP
jgi:hypothetical protein